MPPRRRFGKRLIKSFLPIVLVIGLAIVGSLSYVVYCVTHPEKRPYVVTPESFTQISGRAIKVTDETWTSRDGRSHRGWLLKGSEGAPAVVLLHRYGGDRSWLFNLGVKINETTRFTILWPDLRGHGVDPPVKWTSLGSVEGDDVYAALAFLRTLKSENQKKLVGDMFGIYGVELGAYTALRVAGYDDQVKVLVLDSIPGSPQKLLNSAVSNCVGVNNSLVQFFSWAGMKVYLLGGFKSVESCNLARVLPGPRVLLLSGDDAGQWKADTADMNGCFAESKNVEIRTDLPLSGISLPSATGEQGEAYDRNVIDFFDRNLR